MCIERNRPLLFRLCGCVVSYRAVPLPCGNVNAPVPQLQLSRQTEDARAPRPPAKRVSRVLGMFSSLEVKVLCPTRWR
jgi:hypothetical protein